MNKLAQVTVLRHNMAHVFKLRMYEVPRLLRVLNLALIADDRYVREGAYGAVCARRYKFRVYALPAC